MPASSPSQQPDNDALSIVAHDLELYEPRHDFRAFTEHTFPKFEPNWFTDLLAEEIELFLEDCWSGKQPRLMIFAPPRHGKSEQVSRRMPAYAIGRHPDDNIISASYSSTLAGRMSTDVNRIMADHPYRELFEARFDTRGESNPSGKISRSDLREVIGGDGSYRAAGVGEGITGTGGQLLSIDDPIKSAKEALSSTVRDSIWDWYVNDAYTRLEPKSGVILVTTRWHADDLAGRLLKASEDGTGDKFRVVRFPAIAEEDEYHPRTKKLLRRAGEALVPHRYPLERLEAIRAVVGEYTWNALYQQRPSVRGGSVFKGEWWQFWTVLPQMKWRAIFADTAQKTKERNDYSVFQHWGLGTDNRLYLIDQIRGKWEAPELLVHALAFWRKVGPSATPEMIVDNPALAWKLKRARKFGVEDKASGTGLIQQLKREGGIPIKGIPRSIDKTTRALDAAPHVEAGNVVLPANAEWLSDYLFEMEAFTLDDSHAHDDMFDPTCDAINEAYSSSTNIYQNIELS